MQYQHIWDDLMEEVEAAVAAGESRREAMEWARDHYDTYCGQVEGLIHGPGEPVWDVQGRL